MDTLRPNSIKQTAAQNLEASPQKDRILLIFCGIVFGLCALLTGLNYLLDSMMASAGGLGGLGKRTMIQTVQQLVPIVNMIAMLILELGLWNAMLRIGRKQFVSPHSLRMGLARFFPWLRCSLLQAIFFVMVGLMLMNVAMIIFFATPFSRNALELTVPLALEYTDSVAMMETLAADQELLMTMFRSLIPMYVILAVLMIAVFTPIAYRLRLARLIILDDPTAGAFRAVFESFRLTKGNWKHFLMLDLSFWWYYVLLAVCTALNFLDIILAALGMPLPMDATAASLVAYGIYLVCQTAIYYFLRPRVQVSTAVLYEAILPKKEEPKNAVVLGNIFQM